VITQRNQIFFGIASGLTAKLSVMDFEILSRSAILATPAVAVEYHEPQPCICFGAEVGSWTLRQNLNHADTF
jgi:hypothetical protein